MGALDLRRTDEALSREKLTGDGEAVDTLRLIRCYIPVIDLTLEGVSADLAYGMKPKEVRRFQSFR